MCENGVDRILENTDFTETEKTFVISEKAEESYVTRKESGI